MAPSRVSSSPARPMGVALFALLVVAPTLARATGNENARLALHLAAVTSKNACSAAAARPACPDIVTQGALYPNSYFAYVLVTNGDLEKGVAGAQFGIQYEAAPQQGVDIFSWHNCAGAEFPTPDWPEPGGGNVLTWIAGTQCQRAEPGGPGTGVMATLGYFYLAAYSPGEIRLATFPSDGTARVADCNSATYTIAGGGVVHDPPHLGTAGFSADASVAGHNPCDPASLINCAISGPASVLSHETALVYSANAAPANATFAWSVDGQGTIVGPTTGRSIEVSAVWEGYFDLYVTVTSAGIGAATCNRRVTVQPVPCAVAGPDTVWLGDTATYSAQSSLPGATYQWTVYGGGTILSYPTPSSVLVLAGPTRTVVVAVTITAGTVHTSCSRTTEIIRPTCQLSGPGELLYGMVGTYRVTSNLDHPNYQWLLNGNASMVGPTTGPVVTVQAMNAGTGFRLDVQATDARWNTTCSGYTSVHGANSCDILGPTVVISHSTGITHSLYAIGQLATVDWSIAGDGTIVSDPHQSSVQVASGAAGSYELTAVYTSVLDPVPAACSELVVVNDPNCVVNGPSAVPAYNKNPLTYRLASRPANSSVEWSVTGNGLLLSNPADSTARVGIGGAGDMIVWATITEGGVSRHCGRSTPIWASSARPQAQARLLLHLTPTPPVAGCPSATPPACADVRTSGTLFPTSYYAWLLVADGARVAGIGGLKCGLAYDGAPNSGVDLLAWTLCADAETPVAGWPGAGSGNLISWNGETHCQRQEPLGTGTGVVAVAGYFYLTAYSPDRLTLLPHPVDGVASAIDCYQHADVIGGAGFVPDPGEHLGWANFTSDGLVPGFNPCLGVSGVPDASPVTLPGLRLEPNAPNPFRGSTAVAWWQERGGPARVTVLDLQGRLVARLFEGPAEAGRQVVSWNGQRTDGAPAGAGLYVLRVQVGAQVATRKLVRLPR